jgi:hypothetical protein
LVRRDHGRCRCCGGSWDILDHHLAGWTMFEIKHMGKEE